MFLPTRALKVPPAKASGAGSSSAAIRIRASHVKQLRQQYIVVLVSKIMHNYASTLCKQRSAVFQAYRGVVRCGTIYVSIVFYVNIFCREIFIVCGLSMPESMKISHLATIHVYCAPKLPTTNRTDCQYTTTFNSDIGHGICDHVDGVSRTTATPTLTLISKIQGRRAPRAESKLSCRTVARELFSWHASKHA